jgi:hypothetical protein
VHPQITSLLAELDAASARASEVAARADEAVFHARPPSGGWSAAECIAHLTLTTAGMLPRIDAALEHGRTGVADDRRYRRGLVGGVLAWSMEPPVRTRVRTQPPFVPHSVGATEAVLADFQRAQAELASRIRRASGLNLDELRMASPFNERVKYNVYAAFCIVLAHERRHLWQAERALEASAGPARS